MVPGYTRVYTLIELLINIEVFHSTWEEQQLLNKPSKYSTWEEERVFHNMGSGVFHTGVAEVFYME